MNPQLRGLPVALPMQRFSHAWHQFTIRAVDRDGLAAHLKRQGIGAQVYYPEPLHKQPAFAEHGLQSLPEAERAAREVLSLPLYPEMTAADVARVATAVQEYYNCESWTPVPEFEGV